MELHNDDCLIKMAELETNSIDMLFCDLPSSNVIMLF